MIDSPPALADSPGHAGRHRKPNIRHRRIRRRWAAAAIAIAAFLTTIDNTIVNVALPSIQRDLCMSLPALQWVVTGYLIAFSALMLTGGRLADRYGRRRILLLGLAIFTAASLLAGVADTTAMLQTARVLQGAGAAFVLPAALAVAAAGQPRENGMPRPRCGWPRSPRHSPLGLSSAAGSASIFAGTGSFW